jgi:hypothetical protein
MSTFLSGIAVVALPPALAVPTVEGSLHFLLLHHHAGFCKQTLLLLSALPHEPAKTPLTQHGFDERGLRLTALGVREWEL